jgi:formylglycine-generating enzyme required for sulfatase activity
VDATANGYRLPTEAQWEFAARGGVSTQNYEYSGSNDVNAVAWYDVNSGSATHAVGTKQTNELGVSDMSGNVWEWCENWYPGYEGSNRGNRGGSWNSSANRCSVAGRFYDGPSYSSSSLGFRVARPVTPPALTGFAYVEAGTLPGSSQLSGQSVSAFYIAKTETTWGQWQSVRTYAAANGYDIGNSGTGNGDDYPVTNVSWYQVVKWCNARSEQEGLTPAYQVNGSVYKTGDSAPTVDATANGYRLPTEAQWEFAARGGVSSQNYEYSGSNDINAVAWYYFNSGDAKHAVGTKLPNELGVSDMSGNVLEWCESWYPGYEGSDRVVRGGSWIGDAYFCRVAYRNYNDPSSSLSLIGFRVARSSVQ